MTSTSTATFYNMTKSQFSAFPDDVRIPAEVLLDLLAEINLMPDSSALSPEGGIAFFFQRDKGALLMTADIEIHANGDVSASVIPYMTAPDGHDVFESEEEPIDLWEIEEPPPFHESLLRIQERLGLIPFEPA